MGQLVAGAAIMLIGVIFGAALTAGARKRSDGN